MSAQMYVCDHAGKPRCSSKCPHRVTHLTRTGCNKPGTCYDGEDIHYMSVRCVPVPKRRPHR